MLPGITQHHHRHVCDFELFISFLKFPANINVVINGKVEVQTKVVAKSISRWWHTQKILFAAGSVVATIIAVLHAYSINLLCVNIRAQQELELYIETCFDVHPLPLPSLLLSFGAKLLHIRLNFWLAEG